MRLISCAGVGLLALVAGTAAASAAPAQGGVALAPGAQPAQFRFYYNDEPDYRSRRSYGERRYYHDDHDYRPRRDYGPRYYGGRRYHDDDDD